MRDESTRKTYEKEMEVKLILEKEKEIFEVLLYELVTKLCIFSNCEEKVKSSIPFLRAKLVTTSSNLGPLAFISHHPK